MAAVVTGALGTLLPKLGELAKKEYVLQKGVKKKIDSLSRELTVVHAVLRKIGDMPPDQLDELVRLWASEVREASYDMEDIVDAFLVRVDAPEPATEPHMLRRLRKKMSSLFKKSKARHNISSLIDEINEKLEEVAVRRGRYTLDSIVANPVAATAIDRRILDLYKRVTELIGIEGPRDELIDMLSMGDDDRDVSSHRKMKTASVVGFGGLGKTTLAKAVYDQLEPHFELGAFVPVGRNPDIKKVLRDILIGLNKEKFMNLNMTMLDVRQLMDELKKFINGKRCFIVIDDIWDEDSWKLISCAMQDSDYASRFIITTRIFKVASHADEVYKVQPLSHDDSEKLLLARISDVKGNNFGSPSVEAYEKILKKCSGVPLAIITIASLLASRPGEDWSEVYNSIGFGHEDNDDVTNTRRILSFSYYDLPSHLKPCLLCLSVFPEDHKIEKNSLIWKWVAEGFITEEQAAAAGVRSLFELGERCFNELINRSMILAQESGYEGYVDACSLHDMVLDLIHQLSIEENFVTVLNGGERQKPQGSISRRVALQNVEEHNVGQLANIAVEKVRSIFASQCDFCALCPRLPFLRVVEMVECSVLDEDYGKDLSEDYLASLLHLRYLILAGTFKHIPRNVRYLRFLQTLDLRNTKIEELPEEVALLTQLVCLRLKRYREASKPAGLIGKLTSLQELWLEFCVEEDAAIQFVKDLGLLRELRVLKTRIFGSNKVSALLESLGHLHKIQELQIPLFYHSSVKWVSRDAGLLSCPLLRFLHLDYLVFPGLPAWINSSLTPNLSCLYLSVVFEKDQDMEILAKLPELSCLRLHLTKSAVSIKIRNDEGVSYFPKLRFLIIYGQSLWFDLHDSECNRSRAASNTIMPSLESLEFDVHVRSLGDENLQLGFDELLGGFQNLGTNSLQRVRVRVDCTGASTREVEEADTALKHAAAIHPKQPTLHRSRIWEAFMMSRHQEAFMEISRVPESVTKAWKLADIIDSEHIQILRMPDPEASSSKVMRLLYTDSGVALLALSSNAVHKLWKWEHSGKNPHGKSSKSIPPVLWQPKNGVQMTNDTIDCHDPEEATACFALSPRHNRYLFSASGGKVSRFNMETFEVTWTFMEPPPAATFIAFLPEERIIMVIIGSEDSSIHIYKDYIESAMRYRKTITHEIVLRGHQKKITGLALSKSKKVLVSSGADAQLCLWSIHDWEKKKSRYIQCPSDLSSALVGDTMVQFHYDETHLLVVHERQLAIYDWQLECLCSWFPRDALPAPISNAVYSLGCLLVYAGFRDGAIGIFGAESLTLKCRIAPSAYIPSSISSSSETVYPTALARHPWKPNQIAVGMSDGAVLALEPLDTDDVQVGSSADTEQCPPSDVSNSGGHSQVLDV